MKRRAGISALKVFAAFLSFCFAEVLWAQGSAKDVSTVKEAPMATNAAPGFMVAVIRPSDPNATGGWSFESDGHRIQCARATVMDIMAVAYAVQTRQIVGAPAWLSKERFDINGTPDVPGVPSVAQMRGMYQKLLAERFHLVLHREMREMPIYAVIVAKGGPLLKAAEPGETVNTGNSGDDVQRTLKFTNMSMPEFAHNMEIYEDRPVIDRTGLSGRYDFTLKWTSDISAENAPGAPPLLFTAIREQLGLRMDAAKGPAEVVAIDHVERPSEN